uniref:Uncharacterized protein n=1 Tax=Anguilla anguilla TaxID=7936 RepID=A0A0E9WIC2_ANGAN
MSSLPSSLETTRCSLRATPRCSADWPRAWTFASAPRFKRLTTRGSWSRSLHRLGPSGRHTKCW